jgi:hypothetical protein
MNVGIGWVAFWGFAGRLVICATVLWLGLDALETARTIYAK